MQKMSVCSPVAKPSDCLRLLPAPHFSGSHLAGPARKLAAQDMGACAPWEWLPARSSPTSGSGGELHIHNCGTHCRHQSRQSRNLAAHIPLLTDVPGSSRSSAIDVAACAGLRLAEGVGRCNSWQLQTVISRRWRAFPERLRCVAVSEDELVVVAAGRGASGNEVVRTWSIADGSPGILHLWLHRNGLTCF